MPTDHSNKTLQALINSLTRLITVLVTQNLMIQAATLELKGKRKSDALHSDKGLRFQGDPGPKPTTPREFDRNFLKSLRIRFEEFSEA